MQPAHPHPGLSAMLPMVSAEQYHHDRTRGDTMPDLFGEQTTGAKVASVDHLRREAMEKIQIAARAHDLQAVAFWQREATRLANLRGGVINDSQQDLGI